MSIQIGDITAVILAGGQGRRLGGQDKGLLDFNGRLMIEILIEALQNQQLDIVINANRNQSTYQSYGYPVISDELEDFQGPLAGFASAMATVKTRYILTLPCDSPQLADNFVERFINTHNSENAPVCVAHDGERLQPVYALIDTRLLNDLKQFLQSGERKIDRWYARHDYASVDFSGEASMFENINTPEDRQRLLDK
jgi:molybdenum cofactor guanylyltransferase